ncbi:MAG TPA: phospholipase D-like domain-containing protein, partial [Kiritimatiellia bacterium]|nr:phospholipase D-like domain-containing protein [Kiritimatiellia bacterium]
EAVRTFSARALRPLAPPDGDAQQDRVDEPSRTRIQILTEAAIADAAVAMLDAAQHGDALDVVMFYLADRPVIHALKRAARRGVSLRVLLDPNKDAFGRTKNGMPNRQAARELTAASVPVRWAATHGEQMHAKLLLARHAAGTADLLLGSANFTRRNLRDLNLETNVRLIDSLDAPVIRDAAAFADRLWTNADGRVFSLEYEAFRDDSRRRVWLYRFQEATGLCTW